MKKLGGIALLVVTCLTGLTVPANAGNDTSWIPTDVNYSEPTVHSFAFTDKLPLPQEHSVLIGYVNPNSVVCKSTSDPACSGSTEFTYASVLKVCTTSSDTDCISQVNAIDANGNSSPATFT